MAADTKPVVTHLVLAPKPEAKRFGSLSEDEFKVAACNPKDGTSAKPSFRIHPGYAEQLDIIFHSKQFPYDTPSAIYRHAVKRHAEFLLSLQKTMGDDHIPSIMEHLEIADKLACEEERMANFTESIDRMDVMVKRVGEFPGGERRARQILTELWGEIQKMPVGYWRAVYRKMFRKRFQGQMRKDPQSASLIPIGDSGEDFEEYEEYDDAIEIE